jgi:hypothetical protein
MNVFSGDLKTAEDLNGRLNLIWTSVMTGLSLPVSCSPLWFVAWIYGEPYPDTECEFKYLMECRLSCHKLRDPLCFRRKSLEFRTKHGCAICIQFIPPKYFTDCAEVVTSTPSKVKEKKLWVSYLTFCNDRSLLMFKPHLQPKSVSVDVPIKAYDRRAP